MMAILLTFDGTENVFAEFRIAGSRAESSGSRPVFDLRKKAGSDLAVRGEPQPAARPQKAWVTGAMMPISPTPSAKV